MPDSLSADIGHCLSFLEQHPDADAVSDRVCRYLLEGLGPNSSWEDLERASQYARTPETKVLADQKRDEWWSVFRGKSMMAKRQGFWSIGFGVRASAWKNNEIGIISTIKAGSDLSFFNLSASVGLSLWNALPSPWGNQDFRWQIASFGFSGRWNTGWKNSFVFTSLNIHFPLMQTSSSANMIWYGNSTVSKPGSYGHSPLTCGAGQKRDAFEWSVGITYDTIPAYDQKAIYESPFYDYYAVRELIDSRWRITASFIYYLKW